jgi:hypothetical protein
MPRHSRCRTLTYTSAHEVGCTLPPLHTPNGSAAPAAIDLSVIVAPPASAIRRDGTALTIPPHLLRASSVRHRLPHAAHAAAAASADAPDSSDAQLNEAQLSEAQLSEAQLSEAQLSEAQPSEAQLSEALLTHGLSSVTRSITLLAQPRISSVAPSDGPIAGGTALTVHGASLGSSLADVLAIHLGGTPCTQVLQSPPSTLTSHSPRRQTGHAHGNPTAPAPHPHIGGIPCTHVATQHPHNS